MTAANTRKIEINNGIVLMRQHVRAARICVVSKLVREGKKLRATHENNAHYKKRLNKAERLFNEVSTLKKISDDDISTFGIIHLKDLDQIIQNPQSIETFRAMAKVAKHIRLHKNIEEFRTRFPDYQEYIHLEEKRAVTPKIKEDKIIKKIRVTNVEILPSVSKNNITIAKEKLEDDDIQTQQASKKVTKETKGAKQKDTILSHKVEDASPVINDANIISQTESPEKSEKVQHVKLVSQVATVKRFTEILQEKQSESNGVQSSENISVEVEEEGINNKLKKQVDDFFMTAEGNDKYLSIAVEKTDDIEDNAQCNRPGFKKWNTRSMNENSFDNNTKGNLRDVNIKSNKPDKRKSAHYSDSHASSQNKRVKPFTKTMLNSKLKLETNTADTENLHPSWAAKKKQQEIMKQGFQGKKIVFGDD